MYMIHMINMLKCNINTELITQELNRDYYLLI